MKKCSLILCLLLCVSMLAGCSSNSNSGTATGSNSNTLPNGIPIIKDTPTDTQGFGDTYKGDILFNDTPWGTGRNEVFASLQKRFPTIYEKECKEYDYGNTKVAACTYTSSSYDGLGKVGDMDVDSITVWYIREDGKYNDYSMYAAEYQCDRNSQYLAMAEMLQYKYGSPYAHHAESSVEYAATFDVDKFTWANEELSQKVSITRNNNVMDFGLLVTGISDKKYQTTIEIYYRDVYVSNYVSQQKELSEARDKANEMANKNYEGL